MAAPDTGSALPRIGVVTVSYSSGSVLPAFLTSIPAASVEPLVVVVVDNSPMAEIRYLAEKAGATYLPMAANLGYGGAMNAGVAELPSSVEWVLISNPDVVLSPGSIDAMLAADDDSTIAAIGPAVLNVDGSIYPSARAIPSLRTGVGHALFANLWTGNPWSAAYKTDAADNASKRDAGWLSGSCQLVRRSIFDSVGGFDDGYFMYFEDVDLGYRIGKAGYRNVYEPAATVTHTGAHSTNSDSANMVRVHHDSAKRFLDKKYHGILLWPIRVGLKLGLAIRSAIIVRTLHQ